MPTNVTPEYKAADARYRAARTDEERLDALEEMGRTLNKHKGTEKLYADIKSRIKQLRTSLEKKGKAHGFSVKVEREGAGQLVLLGAPNVGKSSVLAALTHATPDIADYPFTTHAPVPGMMMFEDVGIQLVDLPPVSAQHTESWLYSLVRNADAALLVFDAAAADPSADIESTRALCGEHHVPLCGRDEDMGVHAGDPRLAPKRTILVGTHVDVPGAADIVVLLRDLYPAFEIVGVEAGPDVVEGPVEGRARRESPLPRLVFDMLSLLRVYSKAPGKEADRSKPFVFHRGATLHDFATRVHKDFAEKLAYARVWGEGKFDAQRVHRDYALMDGDVIELHL